MALESPLTQIKSAIDSLTKRGIAGSSPLDDGQKLALIRPVLEFEMPTHVRSEYLTDTLTLSFRALDKSSALFRRIEYAQFDDSWTVESGQSSSVLETLPMDLEKRRVALAYVTNDSTFTGGLVTFDLCLNARSGDSSAGFFLNEARGLSLTWGSEIACDVYDTDEMVMRLTLTGVGSVYAVQVRLVYVASLERLTKDVNAIAHFAAARYWDQLRNAAIEAGNSADSLKPMFLEAERLRRAAAGYLSAAKVETGDARIVPSFDPIRNVHFERVRSKLG